MDAYDAIITRRSIKRFSDRPVPDELVEKVIQAGLYAPSGMNRQSPIVVAITDRGLRDRLSKLNASVMNFDGDPFYGAPVVLAVLADQSMPTYVCDGSLTIGNMLLAAHALGLGACWIHRAKEEFETEEGKKILNNLGVGEGYMGIGHCVLGYPDCEYPEPSPRKENRVFRA